MDNSGVLTETPNATCIVLNEMFDTPGLHLQKIEDGVLSCELYYR